MQPAYLGRSLRLDVTVAKRSKQQQCAPASVSWGALLSIQVMAQLQKWESVLTRIHSYISMTSTDVLDLFFFPSNECTDTQTHSQRFLPLFASDYIKHPGCTNRDGQTSLCRISANCGSSDNRHTTLKNSWKRCGSTTQPPLLQSVMNTGPVCCRQKGGAHTQSHKHTHLYVEANISHLLAAARTTIQFSPVTQTHTSSHIHKEAHWLSY